MKTTSAAPAGNSAPVSPLTQALATKKGYYSFLVFFLVMLSAQGSFVNDMYTPALPSMCRFFGCSVSLGQMGLTMGMIGLAAGQTLLGPLSDRYGRKPVLIGATALFIVAAVASIFSPSIHVFNLCRLFQGAGASAGYFLAKTIPADAYSGRRLAKLMALIGAINGIAPASSPIAGGFLADAFGWKSIFIVLACFATLLIVLSLMMKESLPPAMHSTGSILSSFRSYLVLLRNRPFMIHVILRAGAIGLLFAYISSSPFIMQNHYGLSQTTYGIVVGANSLFLAAGSMLSLRFRPFKKAAAAGTAVLAAGVVCLAASLCLVHNFWFYDAANVVMLFGMGMILSAANTLAMNEGRAHSGEASAIVGVIGYVVGSIVSPLAGLGDIMISTAIVSASLTVLTIIFAVLSDRLPADLDA